MRVTRGGVVVGPELAACVRRELTVAPVSLNDPFPKKFRVYSEAAEASDKAASPHIPPPLPGGFVVPIHWAVQLASPTSLRDVRVPGAPMTHAFNGHLRADLRQPEAVEAVLSLWRSHPVAKGAMLCLPPGQGKTCVALHLACRVKKRTLVIVHKSFLMEQWEDRIRHFVPSARVTKVQGDVCDTSGDFVLAMLQTLVSRQYPPSTFDSCGFLVADECFPYRQLVLTESGSMPIGQVYSEWRAGKTVRVQSFDEQTKSFAYKPVTYAWQKEAGELVEVTYAGGTSAVHGSFQCTPSHRILTTDGWCEAQTVCAGTDLVSHAGNGSVGTVRVTGITRFTPTDTRVYDLEVEGTHTFVCSSISGNGPVVHNCHHIGAQVFSQAMMRLCLPVTLGLTATPNRKDGLSRVVTWFLGPIALYLKREDQHGTRVNVVKYTSPAFDLPPPTNRRGDVCFTSVVTALVNLAPRTAVIVDEAQALARAGRDVLVLSHRREHCKALAEALVARGVDAATYLGGDKTIPTTRVIVATYSLTSEGFDLPRLNALVLATPASDVEQSCGRVMRGASNAGAVIVDVVDQWGVCFAQAAKRRAYYKRSGFQLSGAAPTAADADVEATGAFGFLDD